MRLTTKGDLVQEALRKISVASSASLTDVENASLDDGLRDLEMMMAGWLDEGIETGYQFSAGGTQLDPNDVHGIPLSPPLAFNAVIFMLATNLTPDYLRPAMAEVTLKASRYKEQLLGRSVSSNLKKRKRQSRYGCRMPVGSGNRGLTLNGVNWFHNDEEESCP